MVGGAETQLVRLAGALVDRNWHIRVISFAGGARMESALARLGIEVVVIDARGPLGGLRRVQALLREIRASTPDCVVTFMLQANVLGRLVGKWTGTPVVSSIRNTRFGGSSRLGQHVGDRLERATAKLAVSTVVNSDYAARELARRRVTAGAKVQVIPNGVLQPERVPTDPSGSTPTAFTWLAVGRLAPQKNYGALVEGFRQVVAAHPEARLLIAGEGSERPQIEDAVEGLGLGENIRLLGERSDVPELLASSDAFILASGWEGMPNVVMEAMTHGVPTVATPVGGVPELIVDEETGWIAEGTSASALAKAMLKVMSLQVEHREVVAAQGRTTILEKFSIEKMVDAWARVITSAVGGSGSK